MTKLCVEVVRIVRSWKKESEQIDYKIGYRGREPTPPPGSNVSKLGHADFVL